MTASRKLSGRPAIIMAGGTGGHVIPALSVAQELQSAGVPVVWLGTRDRIEAKLVPAAGIPIHWLHIGALRGKGLSTKVLSPFRLAWATLEALALMIRLRPRVVLGMGGFAAGPGGLAARLTFRRLVIHEQNAVAGMTNRVLSALTKNVAAAYPQAFLAGKATHIGNPVRAAICDLPLPRVRMAERSDGQLRVLVLGGSQGARALNQRVPEAIAKMDSQDEILVWHQAGEASLAVAEAGYSEIACKSRVVAFIDDMAKAYAWADVVVCRAGALTIAELCAAGLGAILVPFPHAVDDHQTDNSALLVDAGTALLIQEKDLTAELLATELTALRSDRERILAMAENARRMATPRAARDLAAFCLPELFADMRREMAA